MHIQVISENQVHNAMREIIKARNEKSLNWCVNYATAALNMTGEELRVQCIYILHNMERWRAPEAIEVRLTLRRFVKEGRKKIKHELQQALDRYRKR